MIEDYDYKPEELSDTSGLKSTDSLSDSQLDYLNEVLPTENFEILADRIDELTDIYPPKAIDANRDIAELIAPVRDQIDSKLLEAPNDAIQIEQISDAMHEVEGIRYEEWKELSFDQRMEALNEMEHAIAEIEHRNPCPVYAEKLGEKHYGYFNHEDKHIVINSEYINSDSFKDHSEVLNTLIHEGRHAYQDYNLTEREVHPRQGELENWRINEQEFGYRDAKTFGFESYSMQPLETDASAFANDVLKRFNEKIA